MLLKLLPPAHRLHERATDSGSLRPDLAPDPPRTPFTDDELRAIKARHRRGLDPDDVRGQLQESKLVQMWNADGDMEEDQWREYDAARPMMEIKKDIANLPDYMFDEDDVVVAKRSRAVSASYQPPVRRRFMNEFADRYDEFEEGEIEGEEEDDGRLEEGEIAEQSLQTLQEMEERLNILNANVRAVRDSLSDQTSPLPQLQPHLQLQPPPPSPPSPPLAPESNGTSEGESDDSARATCGDFSDNDEDDADRDTESSDAEPGGGVAVHIDSWLSDVHPDSSRGEHMTTITEVGEGNRVHDKSILTSTRLL